MSTESEKKKRAQKVFEELCAKSPNKSCVDCPTHNPQWASVSHGTFLCIKCAGIHRGLGVHLSFVRSCTMDQWSPVQLERMKSGGNARMKRFWEAQKFSKSLSPLARYDNDAMEKYRAQVLAEAKGAAYADLPFMGYKEKKRVPKKMGIGSTSSGGHGNGRTSAGYGRGGQTGFGGGGGPTNTATNDAWGDLLGSLSVGASKFGTVVSKSASVVANQTSQAAMYTRDKAAQGFQSMQDEDALKDVGTKLKSGWTSMANWMTKTVSKIGNTTGAGNEDLSFYNKDAVAPVQRSGNMKAYGSDAYFKKNSKQMPSLGSDTYFSKSGSAGSGTSNISSTQDTNTSVDSHTSSAVVVNKRKAKPAARPKPKPKPKQRADDWGFDGFGDGKSKDDDDGGNWGMGDDLDEIAAGLDEVKLSNKTSPERKPKPKPKKQEKAARKQSDPGDDPDDWGWN